jgi:hypothetical protein
MVTLIVDKYKLELFTFEKMGSRSIEGSILGKVGMGGPEGYIDPNIFDGSEYDPKIKIRNINGGFEITGGIFDYRKYEDRLSESYYDNELERVIDELWPSDYTRVLVYRDTYKRLISGYYWMMNNKFNTTSNYDIKYNRLIVPDEQNFKVHKKCFENFCRLYYVDRKISDGHLSAIWEQIPENYLNQVDYKINLENFNDDVIKILKKLKVNKDKRDKFFKVLIENKLFFTNKKSIQDSGLQNPKFSIREPVNIPRISNDYYSYYEDMPREILDAINTFYEAELDYTGIEKL